MKINKVLLIQKLAENKMKYVLELIDMPDFTDESGNKVEMAHCTAFMERETNVFDNSENVHCHFSATDEFGHIYDYKFNSVTENMFAINIMNQFVDKIAPVFPVVECGKSCTFKEYEALVKENVKFSYISSPLMTFGVPFGVKYTGGTVTDIRCFSDNTLFTGLHGQRMLKSGDRLYMECGHLGSLSIPAIKSCWSCHEINNNPQSWTFIVSKTEQLQDYSGDNLKARIEDTLKSGGVNADEVCALLEKYSGYFDVCDDILKVFAKQPAEPAEKQIVNKEITLDVMQQTVLNAVYSMDSDKLKETYKNCGYYVAVLKVKVSFNEHVSMKIVLAVDNKKGSFYSYAVLLCDGEEILHSAIRDQFLGD